MLATRTGKATGADSRSARVSKALVALAVLMLALSGSVAANRVYNRPLVIAHRGGAAESTENTIDAFRLAVRLGADVIETDIRLTRDGVVVVYHDDYFGRVEGLVPAQRTRLVSDMTYDDLTKQTLIPVGEDTGGRKVPTLL